MMNRSYKGISKCQTRPYMKIQVKCLIDNLRTFRKKEKEAATASI
jgi:hypothetical protein